MSPWLFNIYLDVVVMKEALPLFKGSTSLNNYHIQVTMFADDTACVAGRKRKRFDSEVECGEAL